MRIPEEPPASSRPARPSSRKNRRYLGRWLLPYLLDTGRRRARRPGDAVELILCIADHFEPNRGGASLKLARERVRPWVRDYPRLFADVRDSDGRPPRHTFFYPIDEYEPEHVEAIAGLCRRGFGEVEIHLHHDGDTASHLLETLHRFKRIFADRHGLLARDRHSNEPAFGFIHGNWALDNSRPDGRWCGVDNELDVLRESGCYADFTLPSAPSPTQTRTINRLYYAVDDPNRPRSHDFGVSVGTGPPPPNALMLIQGPLLLDWHRRKAGLLPRIENGCLQRSQPIDIHRLDLWLQARIQVPSRPDWFFVKLHTHGAVEANQEMLLGEPMIRFHRALAHRASVDPTFRYHYVTAREMYNLVTAAVEGWRGSIAQALDYRLLWNGQAAGSLRPRPPAASPDRVNSSRGPMVLASSRRSP